jgi:hypothetical protein
MLLVAVSVISPVEDHPEDETMMMLELTSRLLGADGMKAVKIPYLWFVDHHTILNVQSQ